MNIKRIFTIILVLLSVTLLASIASADGGAKNNFYIGLWEGVDPNDGSRRTISITDNDRDGIYDLVQYDTFWTLCGDDQAVAEGTGTVGSDGVLHWSGTLTCFSTGADPLEFSVDYIPVKHSGLLIEQAVGIPLEAPNLHRVSNNRTD